MNPFKKTVNVVTGTGRAVKGVVNHRLDLRAGKKFHQSLTAAEGHVVRERERQLRLEREAAEEAQRAAARVQAEHESHQERIARLEAELQEARVAATVTPVAS